MTLKSQVKLGRVGTSAGIIIIAGLLYYIISRRDAIVDRAFGALDNRIGGSGAAPAPEEAASQIAKPEETEAGTRPQGGSAAPKQPTGALQRLIYYVRQQPAQPTQTQRRQETVNSFQNAFPSLSARYSSSGNRLIVTDRNQVQYATSTTPNPTLDFYNSLRNQRPTGTFGGAAQRATAPANARRALQNASPAAIANFRNILANARTSGYQANQRFD